MAEDLRHQDSGRAVTEARTRELVAECKRQEESCLYTSTALFEWLKSLRFWRGFFVVAPVVLSGIASAALLKQAGLEWAASICAILAGIATAVYKALGLDVSLNVVSKHAHEFKILQDRFRQAWRVTAHGSFDELKKDFDKLMGRMDAAREASLTPPERFFQRARKKIEGGDYSFAADAAQAKADGAPPKEAAEWPACRREEFKNCRAGQI